MTPRMLVLDIDGTTLTRDHALAPEDRHALQALRNAGIPVSLATGRLWSGTQDLAHDLELRGPVACMNGSEIIDPTTGQRLLRRPLDRPARDAARLTLDRAGLTTFLFASERIVHCDRGTPFTQFMRSWSNSFARFESVFDAPDWACDDTLLAVAALGDEATTHAAARAATDALPAHIEVLLYPSRAGVWALHLRDRRDDKGTALDHLAAAHGLGPDDVVAVGDWLNDLPMLRRAGRSFAMAQAPEAVRDAATHTLESSDETGGAIAEVAHRVWGIASKVHS